MKIVFSFLELGICGIAGAEALRFAQEYLVSGSYARAFFAGVFAACFLSLVLSKVVRDER